MRALITGAGRGIGRAAACALAARGADPILVDMDGDTLRTTANEIGSAGIRPQTLVRDMRDTTAVAEIAEHIADLGGLDILVNAAGVIRRAHATEATLADLDDVWAINVRALYALTQAVLPSMIGRRSPSIINVGSLGSLLGLSNRSAYAATKGAVRQYTQSLAIDLGAHGVRVNAIAPGYIATEMNRDWLDNDSVARRTLIDRIPLGRLGCPDDLAGTFVFLASRASAYLTGQLIVVDGGWSSS
jgi:NAD(P)-dependent dehydrogenase (short-subunit alcohol dehydrogenase family)